MSGYKTNKQKKRIDQLLFSKNNLEFIYKEKDFHRLSPYVPARAFLEGEGWGLFEENSPKQQEVMFVNKTLRC